MLCVRRANAYDLKCLAHVIAHSWQEAYEGLLHADILKMQTKPENRLTGMQRGMESGAVYWILEEDGMAQGMAAVKIEEDALEIDAFYTRKAVWGMGGAGKMMAEILAYAGETGCREAHLWVLTENGRARRFYEKQGFCAGDEKGTGFMDARGGEAMETEYFRAI